MGTIMEALDQKLGNPTPSVTIAEALGNPDLTIMDAIEANEEIKPNPLRGLTADFDIAPDTDLLGKVVGDLQENMAISNNAITGTLHYVTDYTGFSGKESEQHGNYIALHFSVPGMTIGQDGLKVKVNNSNLDSDGIIILIKKSNKAITAVATMGDDEYTLTLDPSALVCEPEPTVEEETPADPETPSEGEGE